MFSVIGRNAEDIDEELKPCPFCLGEAEVYHIDDCCYNEYGVVCSKCFAEVRGYETVNQAISHWNNRIEPTCRDIWLEVSRREGGDCDFACSECGYVGSEGDLAYCPSCGRKVL